MSELLAAPVTVDLTRLQTETSLVSSVNVAPGTYTSLALTIAPNPSLTFQNNTGASLTVGGAPCANGAICTAGLTTASDSQSVSFPGSGHHARREHARRSAGGCEPLEFAVECGE